MRPSASSHRFRRDIQGLRALAVLLVVLQHLTGWPVGGFVGVDIFFVISGFLITGLLLREYARTGTISFSRFYLARVKRILPAAAVTLVTTLLAAFLLLPAQRFQSLLGDTAWSAAFGANWKFASSGTDYFQEGAPPSAIQNFWSLAVEEQFYFIWPWLLLLGLFLAFRTRPAKLGSIRLVAGVLIGVIALASFAWSLYESSTSPNSAYFSTFSRAWELGIGALLAIVASRADQISAVALKWIRTVGLIGILGSVIFITPELTFPGPWALLPTLSTAAIIFAGTSTATAPLWLLENPVSQYLGMTSYSLYLWHFPVIVLAAAVPGEPASKTLFTLSIIALLTALSFHLVEEPARKFRLPQRSRKSRRTFAELSRSRPALLILSVLAIINIGALAATQLKFEALTVAAQRDASLVALDTSTDTADDADPDAPQRPQLELLQAELLTALQADAWPDLQPSIDSVLAESESELFSAEMQECSRQESFDLSKCTWGDPEGDQTFFLAGNSHAMMYADALKEMIEARPGWRFIVGAKAACPFGDTALYPDSVHVPAGCDTRADEVVQAINEINPTAILLMGLGEGAEAKLAGLTAQAPVTVMAPPPSGADIRSCYSPASGPAACIGQVSAAYGKREAQVARSVGTEPVLTQNWFCVDGNCPPFAGNILTKPDLIHTWRPYSTRLKPVIEEELQLRGVL